MAWIMLFIAGLLEVVWAYFMKQSHGFTRAVPTVATFVAMFASFGLLAAAMRSLPLSVSYMAWTGTGAAGAFLVGITVPGEQAGAMRLAAAGMIVGGLVLMKLSSPG